MMIGDGQDSGWLCSGEACMAVKKIILQHNSIETDIHYTGRTEIREVIAINRNHISP